MARVNLKPTTDPIADLLTRLRNAISAGKNEANVPHSKAKEAILKLLKKHGYIVDFKTTKDELPTLEVKLRTQESNCRLSNLERVSKPGRRYYVKAADIPRIRGGRGMCLVSTSKGLMAGHEAKRLGLGGELIAKVW